MGIAVSVLFMDALFKLPENVQKRMREFLEKFEANPKAPGFNYETLNAVVDKKLRSVRVNDTYRVIVKREEETDTYVLLWVDHHDEAYAWAAKRKCEVNPFTKKIQIYCVEEQLEEESEKVFENEKLFGNISESDLIRIGVPQEQVALVKNLRDYDAFLNCRRLIPEDVADNLEWAAGGVPIEEIIELIESAGTSSANVSIRDALASGRSSESFVVIDDQEELRNVLSASIEKWRVFLHPSQKDVVTRDYSGPARVLGEAGTGKTVVAMHRAKRLASEIKSDDKILFTTYSVNLAEDIRANLRKICTNSELSRIEVYNLDQWMSKYLEKNNHSEKVLYGKDLDEFWDKAVSIADELGLGRDFYKEEWTTVVAANDAYTLDDYIQSSRVGRGTRLDRTAKLKVWNVFEAFLELTSEQKVIDSDHSAAICREYIANSEAGSLYKHIIVDEGQDFSSNYYRLIRTLAGEEHPNDIFIVGDAHQRIYRRKAVLSKCGINIKGRSSHLRVNYRTTEETRRFAYSILKGLPFDNLDGEMDSEHESRSFTHGPAPTVKYFNSIKDETDYIVSEIKNLINSGATAKDICLVARTSKLLDTYEYALEGNGIKYYKVKNSKSEDREIEGIRISTMHRVKGLEFDHVFVASVNDKVIPYEYAIDRTDAASEEDTMKSERCLLYVAITRARKSAYLTGYGKRSPFLP